jgi:hypothetical protein
MALNDIPTPIASDTSICVDDDCPLPEHSGECPTERTLEMWRTEAQRCRAMIGRLLNDLRRRDEIIEAYRQKTDCQKTDAPRLGELWTGGPNSCNAGAEVVFIYMNHNPYSVHAVVKRINGPWSMNRVAFCGCEPYIGPIGWSGAPPPDVTLCRVCATQVDLCADGTWRVRTNAPSRINRRWTYTPSSSFYRDD